MATLQNVIDLTRNLLSDNVNFAAISPDSRVGNSYTDAQVTEGINFAIKEYCRANPYRTYTKSGALTPASDGSIAVPADSLGVIEVFYAGAKLSKSSPSFEAMKSPTYTTDTGAIDTSGFRSSAGPRRWFYRDSKTLVLVPLSPSAWGSTAYVCYTQMPTLLSESAPSTVIDTRIIETHQEFLKYGAASYLLQNDNDKQSIELSVGFFNEFKQLIGA